MSTKLADFEVVALVSIDTAVQQRFITLQINPVFSRNSLKM